MAFAAVLHRETRASERLSVDLDGTLRDGEQRPLDAVIRDLSSTGFRALVPSPLEPGAPISIGLCGLGRRRATIVWSEGEECGCRFEQPLTDDELTGTATATVTAPIAFPDAARQELLAEAEPAPVDKYSRATRAAVIVGAAAASWSLIIAGRLLLG